MVERLVGMGDTRTSNSERSASTSVFLDRLNELRQACRRVGEPVSVMMIDVDQRDPRHAGQPTAGTESGACVDALRAGCRGEDVVASYTDGGFVVAMADTRAPQAYAVAERCRQAASEQPEETTSAATRSVSAGVVESAADSCVTDRQLLRRAAIALERAQRSGGNRTVTWFGLIEAELTDPPADTVRATDVAHWAQWTTHHIHSACDESSRALVAAAEAKDPHARTHSVAVAAIAVEFAERMGLDDAAIKTVQGAATLHDIGKIGVPDAILTKPGKLTASEFEIIQQHPWIAVTILNHVSLVREQLPIILHHHERFDGGGYPEGLAGEAIPLGARLLAVADAIDVMLAPRSYKKPYPLERVRAEISECAATQFDPAIADIALRWFDESPTLLTRLTARNTVCGNCRRRRCASGCRQLPKHGRQDPAISVVADLDRCVEA